MNKINPKELTQAADKKIGSITKKSIYMSTISATNNSGEQVLSAALAKTAQEQEAKMALALLESAASTAPSAPANSAPTANLGNNINIKA